MKAIDKKTMNLFADAIARRTKHDCPDDSMREHAYNSLPDAFTKEEIESVLKDMKINVPTLDSSFGWNDCIDEIWKSLANLRKGNEE